MLPYVVISAAILAGLMQASLDKAGVGRVEYLRDSPGALVLMIASIPLTFLSNLGLIGIVLWSFFTLQWLPTLGVVAVSFVIGSLAWGTLLAMLRRSSTWEVLLRVGVPVVFGLRFVAASSVVLLALFFLKWVRL